MDGEGLMGAVSSVVDTVSDVVGGAIDVVKDAGSFIDDAVNDVVPGGWVTVGAAALGAGALGALEGAAAETGLATLGESVLPAAEAFGTGGGALATDAALAAGAGASGTALGDMAIAGLGEVPVAETFTPSQLAEALSTSAPTTDYLGTQALGDATTGAVGSTATPSALGEFNVANISNIGIQTPELSTLGSLGGTAAMDVGTAGLTAEQLANANAAAQVGSNASSGLGYLGGAESLPSGTAGITGVTSPTNWSDYSKSLSNIMGGMNPTGLASALYGGQVNIGGTNIPKSNQPAFGYTQQLPIQSTPSDKTGTPFLSGQPQLLANLLKG